MNVKKAPVFVGDNLCISILEFKVKLLSKMLLSIPKIYVFLY